MNIARFSRCRFVLLPAALVATLSTAAAQHRLAVFEGALGSGFGRAAAFVGDLNADGYHEVAVGSPLTDVGGTDTGSVQVYNGSDGLLLWSLDGSAAGEEFGRTLDGGGDIDGDGFADVIVGTESGEYRVLSGPNGNLLYAGGALVGEPCRVACGGRIDGDAFADYLVSYPGYNFSVGRVYVYSGRTHSIIHVVDGAYCSQTGHGIAVTGDINGDTLDDYIVGSPSGCQGGGAFAVYDAATHTPLFGATSFDFFNENEFGWSVDGAGDVDGDGTLDVVVGCRKLTFGFNVDGFVEVWSGATGLEIRHANGSDSENLFGTSVSRLGDLDGDGRDEVIAGGEGTGLGPPGTARVLSGSSFLDVYFTQGTATEAWGAVVDGGGDFNLDGTPDFLVAAPSSAGTGRVVVYSGAVPPRSEAFCFGDGGTGGCTACPCANDAPSGTTGGCLNGVGASAELTVLGNPSASSGTLRFDLRSANPSTFAILASGVDQLPQMGACPPGSGILSPAFDGLRCMGGGLLRHGTRPTDAGGDVTTNAWSHPGGMTAGQTRHFQCFYREAPALGCGNGQNTSNAISIAFTP